MKKISFFLFIILSACDLDTTYDITYDFINNFPTAKIDPDTAIFDTPTKKTALVLKRWEIGGEKRDALIVLAGGKVTFDVPAKRQGHRLYFGAGARFLTGDGVTGLIIVETAIKKDTIYQRHLNPAENPEERRWFDETINIFEYRGKPIKVIFAAHPGPQGDWVADWFSWSTPILSF